MRSERSGQHEPLCTAGETWDGGGDETNTKHKTHLGQHPGWVFFYRPVNVTRERTRLMTWTLRHSQLNRARMIRLKSKNALISSSVTRQRRSPLRHGSATSGAAEVHCSPTVPLRSTCRGRDQTAPLHELYEPAKAAAGDQTYDPQRTVVVVISWSNWQWTIAWVATNPDPETAFLQRVGTDGLPPLQLVQWHGHRSRTVGGGCDAGQ